MLSRVNSPAARIMPTAISVPGVRSRSSACRSPPSCGPMPGAPARTGRGRPVVPAGGSVTPLAEAGASPAADSAACVPSKVPGADPARRVVGGSAFARAVFAAVESALAFAVVEPAPAFAAVEPAPAFARVRLGAAASVAGADGVAAFAVLPRRAVPDRFGFAALVPSDDALAGDAALAVFVLDAVRRARGFRAGVSAVSAAAVPAAVSAGAGAVALDALARVEAAASPVVLSGVAGAAGAAGAAEAGAAGAATGPPGSVASPAAGSADPPGGDGLGAPDAGAGARMDSGSLIATVGASGPDASGAGAAAAAAAAFATSRVRAAPARPRPIRSGRVEGSAPSTLFSVFFGFAGFFFCLSGFSAIRCECTVQSGHGARSPSDTGQETTICVPASYAVVASRAIDDPKPNS